MSGRRLDQPITRRRALAGAAAASLSTTSPAAAGPASLQRDVEFYASMVDHRSGFAGDARTRDWLAERLRSAGARVDLDGFEVETFALDSAELVAGATRLVGFVPWPAGAASVEARLVCYRPPGRDAALAAAIAVVRLGYLASGASQLPRLQALVDICAQAGARAVVAITEGPTGEIIALNAPKAMARWPVPVLLLGSKHSAAIETLAAGSRPVRIAIAGAPVRRKTANVIARFGPQTGPATVVTSPTTGWFACGGERGPGVAMLLDLARTAAARDRRIVIAALAGHELDDTGAGRFLDTHAPPPTDTAFWLRLGAGMAARAWHVARGDLRPLPSPDYERRLVADPATAPLLARLFAGQPGLERPYAVTGTQGIEGDVAAMIARGYRRHASFFGWHALHHTPIDDARATDAALLAPVAAALQRLVTETNPGGPST